MDKRKTIIMEVEMETKKRTKQNFQRQKKRSEMKTLLDGLNRLSKQKTVSVKIKIT